MQGTRREKKEQLDPGPRRPRQRAVTHSFAHSFGRRSFASSLDVAARRQAHPLFLSPVVETKSHHPVAFPKFGLPYLPTRADFSRHSRLAAFRSRPRQDVFHFARNYASVAVLDCLDDLRFPCDLCSPPEPT